MRKIDYGKIKWDAATNWEFCGSKENLKEICDRHYRICGVRYPLEEFGYMTPRRPLAYDAGDVVTYRGSSVTALAVVVTPITDTGYFKLKFADGSKVLIHPNVLNKKVSIADIPEELIMLARAEAGKPFDLSKCPLKDPGACMKGCET